MGVKSEFEKWLAYITRPPIYSACWRMPSREWLSLVVGYISDGYKDIPTPNRNRWEKLLNDESRRMMLGWSDLRDSAWASSKISWRSFESFTPWYSTNHAVMEIIPMLNRKYKQQRVRTWHESWIWGIVICLWFLLERDQNLICCREIFAMGDIVLQRYQQEDDIFHTRVDELWKVADPD